MKMMLLEWRHVHRPNTAEPDTKFDVLLMNEEQLFSSLIL